MPFTKLQFKPGINRDRTNYSNENGWFDCDKVRFKEGYPETIGGWERVTDFQFLGSCRALHAWVTLSGDKLIGLGTNIKYNILQGANLYDVTPIRATTSAGDVTFSATSGSSVIEVSDTGHGAVLNDYVTFSGAVSLGGVITATVLNAEHSIIEIVDVDTYKIDVGVVANGSDTGNGGASVVGEYQINVGLDADLYGTGWGADPWSAGGWGSPATTTIAGAQLRIWSNDNYGEDLLSNVRDSDIYYWDASGGLNTRAVSLSSLAGSQKAPTIAKKVLVSDRDRHVIVFGCDGEFSIGTQDPLLIRFSDQESLIEWRSLPDTTAGSLRIGSGSEIITAVETKQQVVVFTDVSVHTMQYVGPPFTFGIVEVASGTSIVAPNAAIPANDAVFWMGSGDFYVFDGSVRPLQCPVSDYVFNNFNTSQKGKVVAAHNADFSEVWWFYPCMDSTDCSRYVAYDYGQNLWHYGVLGRTAWIPRGVSSYPVAAASDGYLYYHEFGTNDGSQNPPVGINAYIESSVFDIGEGDRAMFVRKVIPDITFRGSEGSPSVTLTLKAQNFPGGGFPESTANGVVRTSTVPVEAFTTEQYVRIRGRAMSLRVESDQYNTAWRLGSPRIDVRSDGGR